jgi:Fe-S-cluster containining protein
VKFAWLNFHLPYACRDSGMCCTAGWPIPVERASVPLIENEIAKKIIPLRVEPWFIPSGESPDKVAGILSVGDNGHCVFFEAGEPGCSIHAVKPAACVHFPYVCLIDQRGVHVTLSHYCPTAASLLFEHNDPIAIVEGPAPVAGESIEGLDARDSLPPVSSDRGRLMSFDELDAWQRDQVANATIGDFQSDDLERFERARASVPAPWTWPEAPPKAESMWWSMAAPKWHFFSEALHRYAAAKVFASWSLYMGEGVEAAIETARIAAAVLRVETARQCGWFGRELDRESLTEAIRQADLLLVHYADPRVLAEAATSASTDRRPG